MTLYLGVGRAAFTRGPMYSVGKKMRKVNFKQVIPGTGVAGDQYVLAGPLTMDERISRIYSNALPAITSVTGANLGFYYSKDNLASQAGLAVVKASGGNELWSGVSLASAVTVFSDLLTSKNSSLDNTKAIRDLLSLGADYEPSGGVFLVLTFPQQNTAGGTIDLDIEIEEGTTR
jgi:hypothetical protein